MVIARVYNNRRGLLVIALHLPTLKSRTKFTYNDVYYKINNERSPTNCLLPATLSRQLSTKVEFSFIPNYGTYFPYYQGQIQGGLETPLQKYIKEANRVMYWYKNTLKCIISCSKSHFSTLYNKTTYIFQRVAPTTHPTPYLVKYFFVFT